jgi:ABC-type multidrug transport system fused ATPase/permease subunit
MQVLTNPEIVNQNRWLADIYERGGFDSRESFLFFLGIAILVMISFNNAFSALTTWVMYRFAWNENHRLSTRLLGQYLNRPYTFYLSRNTAGLSKNILSEVQTVIQGVLLALLKLVSRSLIAILIIGLIATVNWQLALLIGVLLGGSYATIYVSLRRRQRRLGRERLWFNEQRFKIAAEALGGIKELKVLGRERAFLKRFQKPSWRFCRATASNQVVASLPRYALETIAFSGVLVIILYLLRTSGDISELLPVLTLYVFAGYRLMPSLNEIFTAAILIRFNRAALDDLHKDLLDSVFDSTRNGMLLAEERNLKRLPLREQLSLNSVTYIYPNSEFPSLQGVDLSIRRHEVVGIVGETGAGKTTLVDVVLGLLEPTSGTIEVDGEALSGSRLKSWRLSCGYIPQEIFLTDDSIRSNIAFGVPEEAIDDDAVQRAATWAQIHDFIITLPHGYGTEVGERGVRLSGGQRQRIGIARALYHDPDVLVLDEATSSLDGATEAAVMEMIHNLGRKKTLILIAHRLSTVRACDVVHVLRQGRFIGSGTLDELAERNHDFRSMAGIGVSGGEMNAGGRPME